MRVLVTGGAGFIGSHVVRSALDAGFEVAVLDDFSTGQRDNLRPGVRVFEADLRDRDAIFRAIADFRPELVNHHAAQASIPLSVQNPRLDADINVIGGLNLLDACTALDGVVRHFVFASTGGAIYGEVPDGQSAPESFRLEPKSPYGISKLAFERLLAVYREQRGLSSTILRYANVYGPRQNSGGEAGVVATFFAAALSKRCLTVFAKRALGDGGCVRDYVFVSDVARANLSAMTGTRSHSVMNVGSGEANNTLALARHILRLTGSASDVAQAGARPGDLERSLLDVSRFAQTLGTPASLEAGLAETLRWYRGR